MIEIHNFTDLNVYGFVFATEGMRNPMNSWDKHDSYFGCVEFEENVGPNDRDLMSRLSKAGVEHRTFARMVFLWLKITAPLYWWKEMDRYRIGKEQISCSTMHKIADHEFTMDDFSHEHIEDLLIGGNCMHNFDESLRCIIKDLNLARKMYLETKDKRYWWQMIQLLPSSYNQTRTVCFSYEALLKIHKERKNHKLDEWRNFCEFIEGLPEMEVLL